MKLEAADVSSEEAAAKGIEQIERNVHAGVLPREVVAVPGGEGEQTCHRWASDLGGLATSARRVEFRHVHQAAAHAEATHRAAVDVLKACALAVENRRHGREARRWHRLRQRQVDSSK